MKRTYNNPNGFTLIELLVVIAIISLLLSIIMPAMAKVKSIAKSVTCAAGMKQISVAFNSYGMDNKEYIPVASKIMSSAVENNRPWIWSLLPYINNDQNMDYTQDRPDKPLVLSV